MEIEVGSELLSVLDKCYVDLSLDLVSENDVERNNSSTRINGRNKCRYPLIGQGRRRLSGGFWSLTRTLETTQ